MFYFIVLLYKIYVFAIHFYGRIGALQCCESSYGTAEIISYM